MGMSTIDENLFIGLSKDDAINKLSDIYNGKVNHLWIEFLTQRRRTEEYRKNYFGFILNDKNIVVDVELC